MGVISPDRQIAYRDNGFALLEKLFSEKEISELIVELDSFNGQMNHYGIRDLMRKCPAVLELANKPPLLAIAKELLGENAKAVRSAFFDKIPAANWNVAWHQDTSIAVSGKTETEGFKLWTEKRGIIHVEPPENYLAAILTLRLHLDDAGRENGALRVIAGTHRQGRIHAAQIAALVEKTTAHDCEAKAGDVLLMSPLLLHSSRKARCATHRRIIHIEYSAMALPEPLEWHEG